MRVMQFAIFDEAALKLNLVHFAAVWGNISILQESYHEICKV